MGLLDGFTEKRRRTAIHQTRVEKCVGLSAVNLRCHQDTWSFVLNEMTRSHGILPPSARWSEDLAESRTWVDQKQMLIDVKLSGPRLAQVMQMLWYLPDERRGSLSVPTGIIVRGYASVTAVAGHTAQRIYHAIASVVDRVEVNSPRQGEQPTVIIDDAVGTGT